MTSHHYGLLRDHQKQYSRLNTLPQTAQIYMTVHHYALSCDHQKQYLLKITLGSVFANRSRSCEIGKIDFSGRSEMTTLNQYVFQCD